jgi:hypothetical protein
LGVIDSEDGKKLEDTLPSIQTLAINYSNQAGVILPEEEIH